VEETNRRESIVEEEENDDVNERKEGEANGRGVGDLREDDRCYRLIPRVQNRKSILVGNSTVYKSSQSISGCLEATGLFSSFFICWRCSLQRSKSFIVPSFS